MRLTSLRYRRFHISYLLLSFAIGALAGLGLLRQGVGIDVIALAFISAVAVIISLRSRRWWTLLVLCLVGTLVGSTRAGQAFQETQCYEPFFGSSQVIQGVLTGDPQPSGSRTRVTVGRLHIDSRSYPGEAYVTLVGSDAARLKRGDTVFIKGTIREGFASYQISMGTSQLIGSSRSPNPIRDVREAFSAALRSVVTEPMASLGLGFVVGQRSALPDTLDEQLKIVGLTHIVVASGYNLTILVRFMMRLLSRYSRYLAFIGALGMILLFVALSGLSPSMTRAVIVSILSLLAWYFGRRFHPVNLLLYVAAATALYNPIYIWSDLGWYLSFFAFAGILIVAPVLLRLLYRKKQPPASVQLVTETVSAEVMALPLIAFSFGTLPLFGLIANVLVAPLIPLAMALTAACGVLAMMSLQLGAMLAFPVNVLIGYIIAVVEWLSSVSFAQFAVSMPFWLLIVWYMLLGAAVTGFALKLRYSFRTRDQFTAV